VLDYSIGYKLPSGAWAFRLRCDVNDKAKIHELRQQAISRSGQVALSAPPEDTFAALAAAWLERQEKLQDAGAVGARAASTLAENRRELAMLCQSFGEMRLDRSKKPTRMPTWMRAQWRLDQTARRDRAQPKATRRSRSPALSSSTACASGS
jgi:hypothetical protein